MDYSKSGGPKSGGKEPRPVHHVGKPAKAGSGDRVSKEELLARMKAAAETRKK